MRVLIIGASGLLGKELLRDFARDNRVLGTYSSHAAKDLVHLDLAQKNELEEVFGRFKPEAVIIPGSITAVDFCERNRDKAWQVNVEGIKEAAVQAKKAGAFTVYYSTDYVFDGKAGPYSETARPNPINFYGETKLEAEKIVQKELMGLSLIIRPCGIYGYDEGGINFAMHVLGRLEAKRTVTAFTDQYGTPTYAPDLSRVSLELFKNKKTGIFNVVGPDFINRVRFSQEVAEVFGLDKALIKEVKTAEGKQAAKRPLKGGLKIDKLTQELGITTMGLKEGLTAMKERKG